VNTLILKLGAAGDVVRTPCQTSEMESKPPQLRLRGLIEQRLCWRLTWRARALLAALAVMAAAAYLLAAYPFLAPTDRLPATWLIVEGWMPPYSMRQVADEFRAHNYQHLMFVLPIMDKDDKSDSGQKEAQICLDVLEKRGVSPTQITGIFPAVARKDRTYHSALAVKKWFADYNVPVTSLNVMTLGAHARRSRLLYENAFGDQTPIGIIAAEDIQFNPAHWWRTSEGFREVIGESIAYFYARFFFSWLR
jgi:hypothetical protein